MTDSRIYQIGLTMINGIGDVLARHLLDTVGDAEAIFNETPAALQKIPGISYTLAAEIKRPEVLLRAEKELAFVDKNHIRSYYFADPDYPARLKECPDAPILFYFKGNANLNASHILSIVGTRKATDYGKSVTERFIKELAAYLPDTLIISGLAYGIDVCAHRNALHYHLPTVAVLAHGLDRIYPPLHRPTAVEMLREGGLLTDFPTGTIPNKSNFIRRNRIVAGLADATLVIESAEKGGSLVTADIAFSYGRDVFAFPGRIYDANSKGCHLLIRQNKAALVTSADDLISALCWDVNISQAPVPRQTQIRFPHHPQHQRLIALLQENGEMHINQLAVELNLPVHQVSSLLFELEMDGLIRGLRGDRYQFI